MSVSSPLTCLAWKALPVAYATASIALRFMGPHKPHNYVKLGIYSGGTNREYTKRIAAQLHKAISSAMYGQTVTWFRFLEGSKILNHKFVFV